MAAISVIIPLFNLKDRLKPTLQDVLLQDFDDFEIVLVDDASTDGSAEAAEMLLLGARVPWKLLRLPANRGASEARNAGLDSASGEAVLFFDGDDRMARDTLGILGRAMKANRAPLAFCGFRVCGENREGGKIYACPLPAGETAITSARLLRAFLKGKRYLNASNVLYDRLFLQSNHIRFPRGCRFAEDREFIAKALFHAGRAAVVPEALVSYIQHENQSTCRMAKDPSKYAHEVGVYLRLRKYLSGQRAEAGATALIDSLELPGAVIRMATSAVRSGREDLFWRVVHSERLRNFARKGLKSWFVKPEVAFKAMLFAYAPGLLLRLYRRKR